MSKNNLYNLLYTLIMMKGTITSTMTIGCQQYTKRQNAYNSAFFIIGLPEGKKVQFEEMTGLKLTLPPKVTTNSGHTEHSGRTDHNATI